MKVVVLGEMTVQLWGSELAEEWESHHYKWESLLEVTKELVWAGLLVCTICYQWA